MLWELVATVSAGLGAAGVMMLLCLLLKKLPKSGVPAAAGLGMLLFQIYSEYTWFNHTRALLPAGTVVVAEVPETAFYKPWSYYRAPVLKFVAVDAQSVRPLPAYPQILQANLYFFERRMSARVWPMMVDCQSGLQSSPQEGAALSAKMVWGKTEYTDRLVGAVCPPLPPNRL